MCLSIAGVPLRQSHTTASVRHRSRRCNALWDVVTIHLSLSLSRSLSSSLSHVPLSRNSTFCLATAIPQTQSRLKANHHRATSSRHDNGHLSHLHLLLALSADAKYGQLDISLPSAALPLSLHFSFFFFSNNSVRSPCLTCTQTATSFFFFLGCMQDVNEKRKRLCQ